MTAALRVVAMRDLDDDFLRPTNADLEHAYGVLEQSQATPNLRTSPCLDFRGEVGKSGKFDRARPGHARLGPAGHESARPGLCRPSRAWPATISARSGFSRHTRTS